MKRTNPAILLSCLILLFAFPHSRAMPIDQPGVCYECHADIERQAGAPHVHSAFADGQCSNCHNPHASSHDGLLADELGALCLGCHEDMRTHAGSGSVHAPVAAGECGRCHDPHASIHRNQLRRPLMELCRDCHPQVREWESSPNLHSPVEDGDCMTCHEIHSSDQRGLLTAAMPGLCFACHDEDADFRRVHWGGGEGFANCRACHDPHASKVASLVRENQHAPFEGGDCAACHKKLDSQGSFAIEGDVKNLCMSCHRGIRSFERHRFHHILNESDSCTKCHEPHAANATMLLAADQETLCLRCHFRDTGDRPRSDFVTHAGTDCTECHLPHGADNENYLRAVDGSLCSRCHEAAHRVSHPQGAGVTDPRNGQPVTCVSCHQMHGARFEKYLPLDSASDLCIQCHRR